MFLFYFSAFSTVALVPVCEIGTAVVAAEASPLFNEAGGAIFLLTKKIYCLNIAA